MFNEQEMINKVKNYKYVILKINKKKKLFSIVNDSTLQEIVILPKINKEERLKLLNNEMQNYVFKFLGDYYFKFFLDSELAEYEIPIFEKIGKDYRFLDTRKFALPSQFVRAMSFQHWKELDKFIHQKNVQKEQKRIETYEYSSNSICFSIISSLRPEEIQKKYLIAYHHLQEYILFNKKRAINAAKKNNGVLVVSIEKELSCHLIGRLGKNIQSVAKQLGGIQIIVKEKK